MTTLLEYTINVERLSHFREYIETNFPSLVINYIVTEQGKNNKNNFVNIEFNTILDQSTIDSVNTSVNAYINPTDPIVDFTTVYPLAPKKIVSTTWSKVTNFNFNPAIGALSIIKINSIKNSNDTFDYSLRIVDLNNGIVIQEQTGLNNQQEASVSFDSLSNIPTKSTIFEIHAKLDSENKTGGMVVNSFELIYCQI